MIKKGDVTPIELIWVIFRLQVLQGRNNEKDGVHDFTRNSKNAHKKQIKKL